MKKFYSLLFIMLLAFVGAESAWAREYKAGDDLDLSQLEIDDIIHYGVNFNANSDDFFLAFFASESEIDDENFDDNRLRIDYEDAVFDESNGLYSSGNKYKVVAYKGYDSDTWFAHIYYLIPVGSGEPSERLILSLDENSTGVFSADPDATYDEIKVARTLKADTWNTFSMPFSMTKAQLDANLGSDAEIKRFNRLSVDGENFTLSFSNIDKNSGTLAGAAYMVRTKQDVSEIVVKNAQTNAADNSNSNTSNGYTVNFSRTLHKQIVPEGSYIISNNLFYLVDSEVYIKGFRGYFTVRGPASSNAKNMSFEMEDELVTEIDGVIVDSAQTNVYDLQGRYVTDASKGLYIKNGRKVFIK